MTGPSDADRANPLDTVHLGGHLFHVVDDGRNHKIWRYVSSFLTARQVRRRRPFPHRVHPVALFAPFIG